MSAAFTLDFSGPETPCDFPGCVLGSFHDGEHELASKPKPVAWSYDRHCVVCGVPFTVLGADVSMIFNTCGSQACLLHFARHEATHVPLYCRCPQRHYPHELTVHKHIESYDSKGKILLRWPWSLRFAPSMER